MSLTRKSFCARATAFSLKRTKVHGWLALQKYHLNASAPCESRTSDGSR